MTELVDVLKAFNTDKRREREGVWAEVELVEGVSLEVKVAASRTRAYRTRLLDLLGPYREQLGEGDPMTDEESDEVMAKAMAGTLLTDWRGLTHNGVEIPFKEATAVALLIEIPDLREEVMRLAGEQDRFHFENVEKVAERLGEHLGGGSKTRSSSKTKRSKTESPED